MTRRTLRSNLRTSLVALFAFLFLPLLASTAFAADDDGDGLTNSMESVLGSDPNDADSDDDGWGDLVEVEEKGTDVLLDDTDLDTTIDPSDADPFDPGSGDLDGSIAIDYSGAPTTEAYAPAGTSPMAGVGVFANSGVLRRTYRFGRVEGLKTTVLHASRSGGVPGPGESSAMDFGLTLTYRSDSKFNGRMGLGMYSELIDGQYTVNGSGDFTVLREDGVWVTYVKSGANYTTPTGMRDTLTLASSVYTRTSPEGMKRVYASGVLDRVEDRFGNTIDPQHTSGLVTSITDSRGLSHTVNAYTGTDRVSSLETSDGAEWIFKYNPKGELMKVEGPSSSSPSAGVTLGFLYINATPSSPLHGNLLTEIDGRGNGWLRMWYDTSDRVTSQAIGSSSNRVYFDYANIGSYETTVTDRVGNEKVVTWSSSTLAQATLVEKTNRGVRTGEGDYTTAWTTNGSGFVTAVEYPNGNGIKWTLNAVQIPTERRRKTDMGAADGSGDEIETWTLDSGKYYAPSDYTDPRGNVTAYTLNSKGQPTKVTYEDLTNFSPSQHVEVDRTFNGDGTIATVTNGEGFVTGFTYYTSTAADGLLWKRTVDVGGLDLVSEFAYTAWGDVSAFTDPCGNTTTLTVQRYGNVTKVESPAALSYETQFEYDGNLNVTHILKKNIEWDGSLITPASWIPTDISYTATNKVDSYDEAGIRHTDYEYDVNDNVTAIERGGVRREYVWDERDLLYQRIGDPGTFGHIAATETFTVDGNGHVTDYENARGYHTLFTWDLFDRMEKSINALDHYELRVYDKCGNLTEQKSYEEAGSTDVLRKHHKNHFDEMNRRWKEEDLLQGSTDTWLVRTFTLDKRGLMTEHNDRRGYDWIHAYDGAGRKISDEDPAGDVKDYDLDENGNVVTLTETEKLHGTSTTEAYVTNFAYDAINRMTSKTVVDRTNGSNTLVTQFKLDAINFLRKQISPAGRTTFNVRDAVGRRTEERVQMGGGAEMVTKWTYDQNDNVTRLRDDNSNDTDYTYDALGRLTLKTYESTKTVAYTLDENGNAEQIVDQNGTVIDQGFDDLDRLIGRSYTLASGVGGITDETFAYDAMNRMTEAVNDDSTSQFTYDSLSRIATETQGANPLSTTGKTVTYTYDEEGNRIGLEYPSGFEVVRTYAETPMLMALEDGSSNPIADFQHWHRLDSIAFGNGTTTTYTYDGFRRVTGIVHEDSGSVELSGFDYGFDLDGLPVFEARSSNAGAGDVYGNDAAGRLQWAKIGVDDPAAEVATPNSRTWDHKLDYNMDDLHNLTSYATTPYGGSPTTLSYTTDAMNQYTAIGGASPTYDDNGNLKDDGTQLYKFNAKNQLIEVRLKSTNAVLMTAKFDAVGFVGTDMTGMAMDCCPALVPYPGYGRRFETTAAGVTTRSILQGEDLIENYVSGSLAGKWVYADGLDKPVMMEAPDVADVDGDTNVTELERFYYHTQLIGSVTELTDSREEVVESYAYDPYGATTILDQGGSPVSASPVGNPWMYTGRQNDTEVGLYHYRARAYSPELRRFIQRDPLEYTEGANGLAYAGASPTSNSDALGLESEKIKRDKAVHAAVKNVADAVRATGDEETARAIESGDASSAAMSPDEEKEVSDNADGEQARTYTDGSIRYHITPEKMKYLCPCDGVEFAHWLWTVIHETQHKMGTRDEKAAGDATMAILLKMYNSPKAKSAECKCGCKQKNDLGPIIHDAWQFQWAYWMDSQKLYRPKNSDRKNFPEPQDPPPTKRPDKGSKWGGK